MGFIHLIHEQQHFCSEKIVKSSFNKMGARKFFLRLEDFV